MRDEPNIPEEEDLFQIRRHIPSHEERVLIDRLLSTVPQEHRAALEKELLDPSIITLAFSGPDTNRKYELVQQILVNRERGRVKTQNAPQNAYPPVDPERVTSIPTLIALVDDVEEATGLSGADAVVIRDPRHEPYDRIVLANDNASGMLLHVAGEALDELRGHQGVFPSNRTVTRVDRPTPAQASHPAIQRSDSVLLRARGSRRMHLDELGVEALVTIVQSPVPEHKTD